LDISKVAYEIYKRFYENKQHDFELWPGEVFDQKEGFGLASASLEDIREAFSWLKRKGVIDSPMGSDRCSMTGTGKTIPPEYLIWKEHKELYEKLQKRIAERKRWGNALALVFLVTMAVAMIILWSKGPLYIEYALALIAVAFMIVTAGGNRKLRPPIPGEDQMFAKMWKAYESLRSYELEKKERDLNECVKTLDDVSKILLRERSSIWALVEDKIFGMFHKLGTYIKDTVIPLLRKGEAERVRSHIVEIGTLLQERDVQGLIGFVGSLDVKAPTMKSRIPSLSELAAKPIARFALGVIGFSVLIVLGFYGVSILQNQPLTSYAHLMFGAWITVVGAAAAKILL